MAGCHVKYFNFTAVARNRGLKVEAASCRFVDLEKTGRRRFYFDTGVPYRGSCEIQ